MTLSVYSHTHVQNGLPRVPKSYRVAAQRLWPLASVTLVEECPIISAKFKNRMADSWICYQRTKLLSFGSRAFRVSAPKVWNSLAFQIRQSVTSHIQTPFTDTLFSVSLSHYLGPRPPMRPDSVPDLGAIQIIYLLTYLPVVVLHS